MIERAALNEPAAQNRARVYQATIEAAAAAAAAASAAAGAPEQQKRAARLHLMNVREALDAGKPQDASASIGQAWAALDRTDPREA
jgi:hypothetical protein